MRQRCPLRAGYVLVLTLGLLSLAAISLAGLARYSLGRATQAADAADDLQRRWGLFSVRFVLLDRAAEILDAQVQSNESNTPPWPKPARLSTSFLLGTQRFTIVLSDEDAKANLNTIQSRKTDRLLPTVRRWIDSADAAELIALRVPQLSAKSALASWGQVFDLGRVAPNRSTASLLLAASRNLTCWGSGRLNLCRASDAAVREIAALALPPDEVGELVERRKLWGGHSADELLREMDLRQPQLLAARRLFDVESRSYSMWVEIDNGQRTWSYSYVHDGQLASWAW